MTLLDTIIEKVTLNKRINFKEALFLMDNADLHTMAGLASKKREALHPDPVVTFVVDRNINYTNICVAKCKFCAFYRSKDQAGAYIISKETLKEKIKETISLGGTQILLQGGMHPSLNIDYYMDLLKFIKNVSPVHIHGFSPPEIVHIAHLSLKSITHVLEKLIDSGLDSIPGGGAEILVDRVRKQISPNKCSAEQWIDVMQTAHGLGLKTTATMMFGHIEKTEEIIEHLMKIRNLQDKTGGFTAFIPWTFQPENTMINVITATPVKYLKVLGLSRIVLDNVKNIQASWVTQGDKIAQVALFFGANDLGSTMIEENVVAAAGVKFRLPQKEMVRIIDSAGYKPVQRDCFYNQVIPAAFISPAE